MWQCVLGKLEKVVGSAPAAQQTRLTTAQVTEQGPGFVKKPFVSQKQFIQEAWWCLISGWKNKTKQRKYMWTINHPLALGNPVVSECEEKKEWNRWSGDPESELSLEKFPLITPFRFNSKRTLQWLVALQENQEL